MNDEVYYLPGYTYKIVQDDFRQKIHQGVLKGDTDAIKILAPLTDNPNAPDEDGIIQYIGQCKISSDVRASSFWASGGLEPAFF